MTPDALRELRQVEEEMRRSVQGHPPISVGANDPMDAEAWVEMTPEDMRALAARLRGAIEGIEAMTREVVEIADEIEGKSWPGGYPIKAERVLEFVRRLKKAVKP